MHHLLHHFSCSNVLGFQIFQSPARQILMACLFLTAHSAITPIPCGDLPSSKQFTLWSLLILPQSNHRRIMYKSKAAFVQRFVRNGGKMVPGGRVELPTPAFSGPRSTGELPRHRGSERF